MGKRMVMGSPAAQGRGGLLGAAVAVALLTSGCTVSFGAQDAVESGPAPAPQPVAADAGQAPVDVPGLTDVGPGLDSAAADSPGLAPAGDGKFTKQGARLAMGEKAIVPHTYYGYDGAKDRYGQVGVTVTSITKGTAADVEQMGLDDRAKGMIPYYIRSTVSREDSIKAPVVSPSLVTGVLADGAPATLVSPASSFTKCTSPDVSFGRADSYERCTIALSPAASQVVGAELNISDTAEGDDGLYAVRVKGTDYSREAIVWTTPRGRNI